MELWIAVCVAIFGAVFGFACGYWFQQGEVDRIRHDCKCREMELDELRKEVQNTTRSTAFLRRWARMGGGKA